MDESMVSPSWCEHAPRLFPGWGWVVFLPGDNRDLLDENLPAVVTANLRRLLAMPFGVFLSLLAFDPELHAFLDSFLGNRTRLAASPSLREVDAGVFAVLYRVVAEVPAVRFSSGSKAQSVAELGILTPARFLLLLALYHRPGASAPGAPTVDLTMRVGKTHPEFLERDVVRMIPAWFAVKANVSNRSAAGLRGVLEVLDASSMHDCAGRVFMGLGGLRGTLGDALIFLARWFSSAGGSTFEAEEDEENDRGEVLRRSTRSNVLAATYVGLRNAVFNKGDAGVGEAFLGILGELPDHGPGELQWLMFNVYAAIPEFRKEFSEAYLGRFSADPARVQYYLDVLQGLREVISGDNNREMATISFDESRVVVVVEEEEGVARVEHGITSAREERTTSLTAGVEALREIAPHLGRYFCEKLLEACNNDVTRAVTSVLEGTLPSAVAHLEFSLDEAPNTTSKEPASTPRKSLPPSQPEQQQQQQEQPRQVSTRKPGSSTATNSTSFEVQILKVYGDGYNDEYDDTLDVGGRVVVDSGAMNLEEDDKREAGAGGGEDEDAEVMVAPPQRRPVAKAVVVESKKTVPPLVPSNVMMSQQQLAGKRAPAQQPAKGNSREMLAPLPRFEEQEAAMVDVDGVRRNAQGRAVHEDVLLRANTNRAVAAPEDTSRRKPQHGGQQRELTPQEQAEREKRSRARKETQGNRARQRGAEKKQAKTEF